MQPALDREKKALEMNMRDVMDNLEDASSYLALTCCPDMMQILSIEAPGPDPYTRKQSAELHNHPTLVHKK